MRIFLTGATGFIGRSILQELQKSGYEVIGLARSDSSAEVLTALGVDVFRGDLQNLESLRSGAAKSDAVIHTAFNHDFSRFKDSCEDDRKAIQALGSALVGSDKKLIVACGMTAFNAGRSTEEKDASVPSSEFPRAATAEAVNVLRKLGVNTSLIRIPPMVHDESKQGMASYLMNIAIKSGESGYIEDGENRIPAVHRLDVANLFKLVLEKGASNSTYHAISEEGLSTKKIATTIGNKLNLPIVRKSKEEGIKYFGWLFKLMTMDLPASSNFTMQELGWKPKKVGLLTDIKNSI